MRLRAAVLLLVALAACDASTAPVSEDYKPLPADQVFTSVEHFITADGVRRAHLRADTAYVFEDSATMKLRVVHLEMFDQEGRPTSTLTSDRGEYNQATQQTVARGSVVLVIEGPNGGTVWTETLHYDPATKRVWSDVATRFLTNDGKDLHGEGFTADDQFSNINITGGSGTGLPLPIGERQ
ncbi:MAG TPA: LPS export ABC transporter periplasmic protein LptC [Longimicrobiales bacterium]